MENNSVWSSSLIGTVLGVFAQYAALLPTTAGLLAQVVITLAGGALSLVINYHIKRWMNRRWPNRTRRRRLRGDSEDETED